MSASWRNIGRSVRNGKMRRILVGLAGAVAAVLLSAPPALAGVAGPFSTTSIGVSVFGKGGELLIDTDVIFQLPDLGFETFDGEFLLEEGGKFGFTGSFILGGLDGDLVGDAFGSFFIDEVSGFAFGSGFWELTEGTGIFEGFTGAGTISAIIEIKTGLTTVKVSGVLIPAPGVLAGMGIAGLTMRRRRRRN